MDSLPALVPPQEACLTEPGSRLLLLLGAPRSGTTWLAKIFDSHPDVLYRHEPDTIDRGGPLPKVVAEADIPAWSATAHDYLLRLARLSRLKTAGQLPLFRKSYRSAAAGRAHEGAIYLLRLLALVPGAGALAERLPVPDLIGRPPALTVIKSVSGCGCAGLFGAVLPAARIVFLVRAPFGQIASMLQGTQLGKLDGAAAAQGLWEWPEAAPYGLTEARFSRLSLVERLAWLWSLLNEKALGDLAGRPGVRVLAYRDLRAAPAREARALFAFAGLDWPAQTEAFLASSTRAHGPDRYYEVRRDISAPETKWQSVLSAADRARIVAIVRQTTLARYLEGEAGAAGVG